MKKRNKEGCGGEDGIEVGQVTKFGGRDGGEIGGERWKRGRNRKVEER